MTEHWQQRMALPRYRVSDAARFAGISAQTIGRWQALTGAGPAVAERVPRKALSYHELIEVGVVAAMRKAGVKLAEIRQTREYMSRQFGSTFPFAEYRFKTDGARLLIDADQIDVSVRDHLLEAASGQFAWKPILADLLQSFDYPADHKGPVQRWRLVNGDVPIIIDPRISFGNPTVKGIPTSVIYDRSVSGDDINDISEDFDLTPVEIQAALAFERKQKGRPHNWNH